MAKTEAKWIGELVGVFSDPIIVMPGGWGDTLPAWIKEAITLERLISNMEAAKTGVMTGSDAEACAYLYTASLDAPMGHDWSQIYLYIAGKVYERHRTKDSGVSMPEDIKVDKLDRNQMDDLNRLKAWIYDCRVKHRKSQARSEVVEKKEAVASLQQKFDLGLDG